MLAFACHRMPVQYVLGEWDFQDLTLKMKPPVFIPRPETEVGLWGTWLGGAIICAPHCNESILYIVKL